MTKEDRGAVNSSEDLNDLMSFMFEAFLVSLQEKEGITTSVDDEDSCFGIEEGIAFLYTSKAERIIDRYKKRMEAVFEKNYPLDDFEMYSHQYRQF